MRLLRAAELLAFCPISAQPDDSEALAQQLANLIANLISVPFQFNFDTGFGPDSEGDRVTLNIQPVVPISVSDGWNMISRIILPIVSQNDVIAPGPDEFGLGDTVQSLFFSPKKVGSTGIVWGVCTRLARMRLFLAALVLMIAIGAQSALAQSPSSELIDLASEAEGTGDRLAEEAKEDGSTVERVIVPVPISNPLLGAGLGLGVGWFYKPGGATSPWATGLGGMATSNGSWGVAAYHKMALADNRLRLEAAIGTGRLKTTFRPTGLGLANVEPNLELTQDAVFFQVKATTQIVPKLLAGAKLVFGDQDQTLTPAGLLSSPSAIPEDLLPIDVEYGVRQVSYGPAITFDTTDGSFDRRQGVLVDGEWLFTEADIFNAFSYNQFKVTASQYFEIGDSSVAALRQSLCLSSDRTPFFEQCDLGSRSNLRGFAVGERNDRASWAVQAELRRPIAGKIGAVAFVGVGSVADGFGEFSEADVLPAGGVGLRYLLAEEYGVNFRIDFAVSKDGEAVYVSLGEAF